MQVGIQYRPSYSLAMVTLEPKEQIQVEAGAMVGMSPSLEMETHASGGFLKRVAGSCSPGYRRDERH
jgi:uncharacterized protein (AIM24 family)